MGCVMGVNAHNIQVPRSHDHMEDAQSFRAKMGAMKMLTKTVASRKAFLTYLEEIGKSEFLVCYLDLEEIKSLLNEDQQASRTIALVARYRSKYDACRAIDRNRSVDHMEYLIWECLGRLRHIDQLPNPPRQQLINYIMISQNEMLGRLIVPFEGFLTSATYHRWQGEQWQLEQAQRNRPIVRLETCSNTYPDILIVDDSMITLKITGLTLERDGHKVDRATDGEIALNLMKARKYDVVLIDLNMPVMDGFEAVRLFRLYENENMDLEVDVDDMSELSDDSADSYLPEVQRPSVSAAAASAAQRYAAPANAAVENRRLPGIRGSNSGGAGGMGAAGGGGRGGERGAAGDSAGAGGLISSAVGARNGVRGSAGVAEGALTKALGVGGGGGVDGLGLLPDNIHHNNHADGDLDNGFGESTTAAEAAPLSPGVDEFGRRRNRFLTREHYHQLIIGMSADIDEETKKRALQAGMDFFLPKPFTLQKFIDTIRQTKEKQQQYKLQQQQLHHQQQYQQQQHMNPQHQQQTHGQQGLANQHHHHTHAFETRRHFRGF